MPRRAMFASLAALAALVALAPAPAPAAQPPLKVVRATKPPGQVKVGDRVTIKVKIRNQSRGKDYVAAGLHLKPASPLPFSLRAGAFGTRGGAVGHHPRGLLKPGEAGKAKLVWKVPRVHRGFDGKLVACAGGTHRAKAGQCSEIGPIHVSGSLLSLRAGVSATISQIGARASIGLAAQELASDGRGVWWAGPERWTGSATLDPTPGGCPFTVLDSRVSDKPRGAGLKVTVRDYGAALTPSNLSADFLVPGVRVTSQTGGSCFSEGDPPDVFDFVNDKFLQLRPNANGVAQFSAEGAPELHGTLTVQP